MGNVGSTSWHLAFQVLRCNPVAIIGMDLSEKEIERVNEYKICPEELRKKDFHRHYHPFFKTFCWTGPVFETYWESFKSILNFVRPFGVETINCTGGGIVYSDDVACMNFIDFLIKAREGFYDEWPKKLNIEQQKVYDRGGSGNKS
jgi:hypothetical protein